MQEQSKGLGISIQRTVLEPRASAILYGLLKSNAPERTFLLPANVCPVVPLTFLKAGVPFEFVDISAETLHMNLDEAQTRIAARKEQIGGLLYVHTYGDPATPEAVFAAIKNEHPKLMLIDDRCLCVPDFAPDPRTVADVSLYSTRYAKIVDIEIGGYAFLADHVRYERCSLPFESQDLDALEQDCTKSLEVREPYAYKDSNWLQTEAEMPPWQRYAERVRNYLQVTLLQRRTINAIYDALIPAELRLPERFQMWRYSLRVPDNRKILDAIFAGGLFASAHYASLAGIFGGGASANADALARQVINLFNDHHYSQDMAERTAWLVLGSL